MEYTDNFTGENLTIYTKKIMRIITQDGRVIERDFTRNDKLPPGFTVPCDDPLYAYACLSICAGGFSDADATNSKIYTHIGPGNIKEVSIRFE